MVGNARRQPWQSWHSRQLGICNLQMAKAAGAFESHPHRHLDSAVYKPSDPSWV